MRIRYLIGVVVSVSMASAGWAKVDDLDNKPAETFLSCNKARTLCIQRVVAAVPPGHNTFSDVPTCINKVEDSAVLEAAFRVALNEKDLTAVQTLKNKGVELVSQLKLGGVVGQWVNSQGSDPESTGRCVSVMAYVPDGATVQYWSASIFDAQSGAPRDHWASCPGGSNSDALNCATPGWIGWDVLPTKKGHFVYGIIKNWSDVRTRYVALDVRYTPPPGFVPPPGTR